MVQLPVVINARTVTNSTMHARPESVDITKKFAMFRYRTHRDIVCYSSRSSHKIGHKIDPVHQSNAMLNRLSKSIHSESNRRLFKIRYNIVRSAEGGGISAQCEPMPVGAG